MPVQEPRYDLRAFLEDRRGVAIMLLAAAAVPFVGLVGLATDTSRINLARSRMTDALDQAGLAAAQHSDLADQTAEAQRFFAANFPADAMGIDVVEGPLVTQTNAGGTLVLTARASVPMTFSRILGRGEVDIQARTVISRQVRGMELALVMDVTGSMRSGGKMDAMKASATELVNILFGGADQHANLFVSVVPFAANVNIGSNYTNWLVNYDAAAYSPTIWKGCVEARIDSDEYDALEGTNVTNDMTDATPDVARFKPYFYPNASDNVWPPVNENNSAQNNGTGPNLGCGPAITPLTNQKQTVLDAIDEMLPWHRGGTMISVGGVWGWRTLSPRWRGWWDDIADPSLPRDYDTANVDKVMIFLTDGENQFYDNPPTGPLESDYTAYGRVGEDRVAATRAASETELDNRTLRICSKIKARNIILYTITFGSGSTGSITMMRDCATSTAHFFNAPSNSELRTVFREIGTQLSELRIAE